MLLIPSDTDPGPGPLYAVSDVSHKQLRAIPLTMAEIVNDLRTMGVDAHKVRASNGPCSRVR